MANLSLSDTKNVKPLIPSQVVSGMAGGSGSVGDLVVLNTSEVWVQADSDSAATAVGLVGIVVATNKRKTTFASGDKLDVVVFGRVTGFTGVNGGGNYYVSSTAGKVAETAGTVSRFIGHGENTTTLFINGVGVATSA